MDAFAIVGIVLGSLLVLGGGGFLVYFFILREKFCKKQIRELDKNFQHLHALLIGTDAQYVKRLELISRTNLLYVETHSKFLKRFKELRDKVDVEANQEINTLRDLVDAKEFKPFKAAYPKVQETVDRFEQQVNALNEELLRVVKPEEDCRQSALTYKEQLRRIKQEFYSRESELVLMATSFDEVFKYIDQQFEEFETLVESAQYDEANSILPRIDGIIHELTAHMGELPELCTTVSVVIPDKIASVEIAYKELVSEKYPLYHLAVTQTIDDINAAIKTFTQKIKRFEINGIYDKLQEMSKTLDDFFTRFEEEKVARESFEKNSEVIYSTVTLIERKFIKLRNTIPEVSKFFLINEEHKVKIDLIQSDINKVGALKRSLDTYIHSATKQPYTILVNKINELSSASDTIISDIDEFNNYIASLKVDAESAYSAVYSLYEKTKSAVLKVREINVTRITEKYEPMFEKLYSLLNNIYDCLVTSPIDIDNVNTLVHEVYDINNSILDDGEIMQDYNMMMLAENAIVFANRHRNHLADVDTMISQAETSFENGDFENAYVIAGDTLKKIKENNGR